MVRLLDFLSTHAGFAQTLKVLRVVKSSRLPVKIASYFVSIGRLLCLAFLYGWHFLNIISLDWLLTLTTQSSTSKLFDNPESLKALENCSECWKVLEFWC